MSDSERIAKQAEANLNTYQSKTGNARPQADDETGANSYVETTFDGASVQTGDDLSTNRSYDKRIPPSEGGDLDARGRQSRGKHFEGTGGPTEKYEQFYREHGGDDDDVSVQAPTNLERGMKDVATQGQEASSLNVGKNRLDSSGSQFKGEDYYVPESVHDSIATEGNIAPSSVIESSQESERP